MPRIENPEVAAVFESYPGTIKRKLLFLRRLIFKVASKTEGVGALEETLRWGQPSYLTIQSKSGSLIRIDRDKTSPGQYAMYFHCQTTLVDSFKEMYRGKFESVGNRSIVFGMNDKIPIKELSSCISMALTYYLNKKPAKRATTKERRRQR